MDNQLCQLPTNKCFEVPEVKFVESFIARRRNSRSLRELYARANAVSSPAMRDELLVIAQRDH
ncbi:hypothetical protein GCM10007304_40350 [Rhodococcoides trifolii]|uniref:Uncharacterized protein n=1 Tax=Rhodococcoides trifolii TaxID=908250 RepID=A0A917LH23_9NOCA|nr:hypothetical protein GCM10007304_40350 [Rhodococcus trifolii]